MKLYHRYQNAISEEIKDANFAIVEYGNIINIINRKGVDGSGMKNTLRVLSFLGIMRLTPADYRETISRIRHRRSENFIMLANSIHTLKNDSDKEMGMAYLRSASNNLKNNKNGKLVRQSIDQTYITLNLGVDKPREADARKSRKGDIAILGSSGSGKTVFFAMLSHVLSKSKYSNLKIEYVDGIDYIRDLRKPLENGEWPAKTYTKRADKFSAKIHNVKGNFTTVHSLRMNDISGEDFTKYIGPDHRGTLPEHMRYIDYATGYVLIMSPDTLKDDMWTFISMIKYLVGTKKLNDVEKFSEPFAIVISKHDQNRHIMDAEAYVKDHAPDLYMNLSMRTRPGNLRFFFCSAVGDLTPEGKPRLPLAPMGVAGVIEWMLFNIEKHSSDANVNTYMVRNTGGQGAKKKRRKNNKR